MPTTIVNPQQISSQNSSLSKNDLKWLLQFLGLQPLYKVDTSKGSYAESPPAAGSATSGYSGQCKEITYVKISSDANTYTLNGIEGGPYTLTAQWQFLKVKSDGTNWYKTG